MSETVDITIPVVRDANGKVACEKTHPYETCLLYNYDSDSCIGGGGYDTYSVHGSFDTKIGMFDCPILKALSVKEVGK